MVRTAERRSGICYARTDEGVELPVVDITHEAFACDPTAAEIDAITAATFRGFETWDRLPRPVRWLVARRSAILQELLGGRAPFVSGMTTYLFKLGPDNLGRGVARMDREITAALTPVCVRLRLRAVARLLADGLAPRLAARRGPLHLLNIAGGPAIDSLNALILLAKEQPTLIADRPVVVLVLDCDEAGPRFGARAAEALTAAGAPLDGLGLRFEHRTYDWSSPSSLRELLGPPAADSVVACSSEGGLFEYGRDEDIVGNLQALRHLISPDSILVGSRLDENATADRVRRNGRMPAWRMFAPPDFETLVGRAGWRVERDVTAGPLYCCFSLSRT